MYEKKEDWLQYNPTELGTSIKGAKNELLACVWFLEQGYEVFRNVSPTGKGDIIIWKKGEDPIIIDIKAAGKAKHYQVKTVLCKNGEFTWVD